MHDTLVKVDNNNIVYAKAAAEYVLSVFGTVDERYAFFENTIKSSAFIMLRIVFSETVIPSLLRYPYIRLYP